MIANVPRTTPPGQNSSSAGLGSSPHKCFQHDLDGFRSCDPSGLKQIIHTNLVDCEKVFLEFQETKTSGLEGMRQRQLTYNTKQS